MTNSTRHSVRGLAAAAAAALLVTGLAACGSSGSNATGNSTGDSSGGAAGLPAVIKIGVPLDLTGSSEITGVGTGEQAGVKFAIDQINSSHFLGNTQLQGVYYDTQADKTQAVSRTIQLTTQDKVSAIVGYTLTDSFLAAAPTAQKAGIPTMAVGLSGSGVTEVGNYMFRELLDFGLLFKDADPEFVKATKGKTAAYLYGSDTVTTSGQYQERSALLTSLGVKTVATQTITSSTTDMSAQLTAIKNANPDYLVVDVDTGQVPQVMSQIASAGIKAQVLGDNGLGAPQTLGSPTSAQGAQCGLFAEPWYVGSQAGGNPQFVKDWEAANKGAQPDLFNALGHDAMWGMAEAIKQANSTNGLDIRNALADLSTPYKGALGTYKWASDGQPTYQPIKMQVQNGKAVVWNPKMTCSR
jgi:branched-chain amino acid transport system substrate-binding protein